MAGSPVDSADTQDITQNPPQAPKLEQNPESFQQEQDNARFTRWVKRPAQPSSDCPSPSSSKKRHHYMSRPSCTHVNMVKLYGGWHVCHLCGRRPRLGFVYACEQDHTHPLIPQPPPSPSRSSCLSGPCSLHDSNGKSRSKSSKSAIQSLPPTNPLTARDLDASGLSHWIVNASHNGHYTPAQIRSMIDQKAHVRNTIALDQAHHHHHYPTAGAIIDKLACLGLQHLVKSPRARADPPLPDSSPDSPDADNSQPRPSTRSPAFCDFKVCHTCRPISRDRVWVSFEAAFSGAVEMPSQWHPFTMPVVDMHTMRSLGSKIPPKPSGRSSRHSPDVESVSASQDDCKSSLSSAGGSSSGAQVVKSQPSSTGFRSSLRKSLIDLLNAKQTLPLTAPSLAPSSLAAKSSKRLADLPTSSPNVCLDQHIAELEAKGLDIELWRMLAEEQQSTAAATLLPGEDDSLERLDLLDSSSPEQGFAGAEMDHAEIAEGECLIRNEDRDRLGLGVTLTEEAVGNHEPDFIIASV